MVTLSYFFFEFQSKFQTGHTEFYYNQDAYSLQTISLAVYCCRLQIFHLLPLSWIQISEFLLQFHSAYLQPLVLELHLQLLVFYIYFLLPPVFLFALDLLCTQHVLLTSVINLVEILNFMTSPTRKFSSRTCLKCSTVVPFIAQLFDSKSNLFIENPRSGTLLAWLIEKTHLKTLNNCGYFSSPLSSIMSPTFD